MYFPSLWSLNSQTFDDEPVNPLRHNAQGIVMSCHDDVMIMSCHDVIQFQVSRTHSNLSDILEYKKILKNEISLLLLAGWSVSADV